MSLWHDSAYSATAKLFFTSPEKPKLGSEGATIVEAGELFEILASRGRIIVISRKLLGPSRTSM
jgi:hypothetical protein